jgi:hypothetical protein
MHACPSESMYAYKHINAYTFIHLHICNQRERWREGIQDELCSRAFSISYAMLYFSDLHPPPTPPFHATLPHSLPLFVVCISVRFEQNGGPMMHKGNTYENLRYAARITIQTCRSYLERHNTHTLSHTHIAPHTDNTHTLSLPS